jgi:hypothetical protein
MYEINECSHKLTQENHNKLDIFKINSKKESIQIIILLIGGGRGVCIHFVIHFCNIRG